MERKLAEWRARQAVAARRSPLSVVSERRGYAGVFSGLWHRLRPRRDEAEQREPPQDPLESSVSAAAAPGLETEGSGASGRVTALADGEISERARRAAREKEENNQNSFKENSAEQPVETDHFIFTIVTVLKFLLWLVLLGLFIELEFGLVYFVLSMFYWIYIGTRDPSEKKQGEVSAYSVFNPGCKAIEGSLTAEQFERELQYRPLAGR
ncbi:SAYSvFN domain-containing protein 1 isoform X1 [Pristis pectinata]|uniref:SAYSvFN domain-containing protein 1 isoform X1 n=1 Tax=Pristis pectinata TaxID=685728 RepID=UPI00223E666E|nr:SAYSvFN domain-containing protein 1 isoform X1 [Pristis pectinata]